MNRSGHGLVHPEPVVGCSRCEAGLKNRRYAERWWPTPEARTAPCFHLGPVIEHSCCRKKEVRVCEIHGQCTIATPRVDVQGCCASCPDYDADTPEEAEMPPITTRNLIFHLYPVPGRWQAHVLALHRSAGLFNGKRTVAIISGPGLDDPQEVERALGSNFHTLILENDPRLHEVASFLPLFESVESYDPNEATLRAHSKGVTRRAKSTASLWTRVLYETCIDYWPLVEKTLARFPIAGSFKKLGRGWQRHESLSEWHYSGSWFWFRNKELFGRRDWKRIDQFWAGIEPYPSLHFPAKQAGCIFFEGSLPRMNLYSWNYWNRIVLPELERFRLANEMHHVGSSRD